jgi:hypothetical protein
MDCDAPQQMVFANVNYPEQYPHDVHSEMVEVLRCRFPDVESGLQSDSWIWIVDGEQKVAVDSFTSMKHQVKSYSSSCLVERVVDALRSKYDVQVLEQPVEEWS